MTKDEQFATEILENLLKILEFSGCVNYCIKRRNLTDLQCFHCEGINFGMCLFSLRCWEYGWHPSNFNDTLSCSCERIIFGVFRGFSQLQLFVFYCLKSYSINWFLLSPFDKKFEKSLETFVFGYFIVIFVAESPFALSEVLMEFSKYQSVTKSTRRCTLGKTDANRLNCNMLKYFQNCPHHWYQCHGINNLHRVFFWSTCTLYIEIFIKYWSMWDTRKP